MNAAVEIKGLVTGYKEGHSRKVITAGIDAVLKKGEMVSLLGPNGAGKSTLLRTLAGFQPPLEGEVIYEGRMLRNMTAKVLSRRLAVVLTERPLLPEMDAETLTGLGRAPHTGFWGRLSANDRRAVDHALELTGTSALRHRPVQSLSDGERQKVMVAKALAQETPVILLDEPTAFLDYPSKVEVMQILRSIAESEGKAILISTHDMEMALQLSHQLWLLDRKLGLTEGTHAELISDGSLSRYFLRPGIELDPHTGLFLITK